jgi:hypothetical protein
MDLNRDDRDIPTANGRAKQANLAQDEKLKQFWESIAEDWLRWSRDQRSEKDHLKH